MARQRTTVARTFAPIHFEDLDPHRFEDLVRELIYDFRDWQSIEATGRSGDDAGFDIRAFEKQPQLASTDADDEEASVDARHPMEGPRWMIQGKREKSLSPSDVKKILRDVDPNDPPYGYILAASAVFSKKSYDIFRDELRAKGVMEFYLWGRAELEDMLHLPKNDRILFTFFGISLVSRRRSRMTEIRAAVNTKNKLYKALGDPLHELGKAVLIRDINDTHYPFEDEYPDFKRRPRWIEQTVEIHHPNGLLIENQEYYAYVDKEKKEWDYSKHANILAQMRSKLSEEDREEHWKERQDVLAVWSFLPRAKQGTFKIGGLLPYADIIFVDPNGDAQYNCPHLYAEFTDASGPYSGFYERLFLKSEQISLDDSWRRIEVFPKTFSRLGLKESQRRQSEKIILDSGTLKGINDYSTTLDTLIAVDDRYNFLQQRDIVEIANSARQTNDRDSAVVVRYIHRGRLADYLKDQNDRYRVRETAKRQIGRQVDDEEQVTILEVDFAYVRDEE
ncbi:hypothetical protein [Bradyrhizobium sp. HKCCYLR1023]|uniref:hypothetical protein n=1 Tax=Bradyrhizobium TaxID=374 RepID=UPI003EBE57B2